MTLPQFLYQVQYMTNNNINKINNYFYFYNNSVLCESIQFSNQLNWHSLTFVYGILMTWYDGQVYMERQSHQN